jgi:hypothetical protein
MIVQIARKREKQKSKPQPEVARVGRTVRRGVRFVSMINLSSNNESAEARHAAPNLQTVKLSWSTLRERFTLL